MSDLDKISSVFNAKLTLLKLKKIFKILRQNFLEKMAKLQQFKSLGSLDPEKEKNLHQI